MGKCPKGKSLLKDPFVLLDHKGGTCPVFCRAQRTPANTPVRSCTFLTPAGRRGDLLPAGGSHRSQLYPDRHDNSQTGAPSLNMCRQERLPVVPAKLSAPPRPLQDGTSSTRPRTLDPNNRTCQAAFQAYLSDTSGLVKTATFL